MVIMEADPVDIIVEQITPGEAPVAVITNAVSALTGDSLPRERLYDRVDPDILEWVIESDNDGSVRVAFEYADCEITVRGDRTVTVIPRSTPDFDPSATDVDVRNGLGDLSNG